MFGFRPVEDLTVTRFYTEPQIYTAMRRMHESDVALRESIARNPDAPVVFIRRDAGGQVIPARNDALTPKSLRSNCLRADIGNT
jgi:hypothetical protein